MASKLALNFGNNKYINGFGNDFCTCLTNLAHRYHLSRAEEHLSAAGTGSVSLLY